MKKGLNLLELQANGFELFLNDDLGCKGSLCAEVPSAVLLYRVTLEAKQRSDSLPAVPEKAGTTTV